MSHLRKSHTVTVTPLSRDNGYRARRGRERAKKYTSACRITGFDSERLHLQGVCVSSIRMRREWAVQDPRIRWWTVPGRMPGSFLACYCPYLRTYC